MNCKVVRAIEVTTLLATLPAEHGGGNWAVLQSFSYSRSQYPWECGNREEMAGIVACDDDGGARGGVVSSLCSQDRHFSYRSNLHIQGLEVR